MMPVIQTLTPHHGVIIHLRSNPPRGFGDRAKFDPSDVQLSVNGIQAQETASWAWLPLTESWTSDGSNWAQSPKLLGGLSLHEVTLTFMKQLLS